MSFRLKNTRLVPVKLSHPDHGMDIHRTRSLIVWLVWSWLNDRIITSRRSKDLDKKTVIMYRAFDRNTGRPRGTYNWYWNRGIRSDGSVVKLDWSHPKTGTTTSHT